MKPSMSLLVADWRLSPLYEQCITLVHYDISSRRVLVVWAGGKLIHEVPALNTILFVLLLRGWHT